MADNKQSAASLDDEDVDEIIVETEDIDEEKEDNDIVELRHVKQEEFIKHGLLFHSLNRLKIRIDPFGYETTLRNREAIDQYFETKRDLFPDIHRGLQRTRFFRTYMFDIENRFPRDRSARALISAFRSVMIRNFGALIVFKRFILLFFIITLLGWLKTAPFVSNSHSLQSALLRYDFAVFLGIGTILWFAIMEVLYKNFYSQSFTACHIVSGRIQALLSKYQQYFSDAIESNQTDENRGPEIKRKWPERANWWTILALWIPKRVENIEKYFQVEMWRVRNYYVNLYRIGLLLTVIIIAGAYLELFYFRFVELGSNATVIAACLIAVLAFASYFWWRPPLNLVEREMHCEGWVRYHDLDYARQLAQLSERDKNKIIDEQNRQRSSD